MGIYPEIGKTCKKVLPEMADDLSQEVMLTLFEKPEAKIMAAYNGGYFLFYVVRIILNLARSKNSSLHKKYGHLNVNEEIQDHHLEADDYSTDVDSQFQQAQDEMNRWAKDGDYPYEKNLFELHLQLGNKKELSRKTGIPYRSICYTIDNCKDKIKNRINGTTDYHNPISARSLRNSVHENYASVVLQAPKLCPVQLRYVPVVVVRPDGGFLASRDTSSIRSRSFNSNGK